MNLNELKTWQKKKKKAYKLLQQSNMKLNIKKKKKKISIIKCLRDIFLCFLSSKIYQNIRFMHVSILDQIQGTDTFIFLSNKVIRKNVLHCKINMKKVT